MPRGPPHAVRRAATGDPSSPFTGGAILGDRIRMASLIGDPGVYVRSMASRAHLGGLAEATPAAVRVLDALGLDVVVVETVGVGQSEVAIADTADCTLIVTMPGGAPWPRSIRRRSPNSPKRSGSGGRIPR
ncbi:hypothetical protein [Microtetraspora sp. NBRC 16547]|uniref:hypothetical protein n=1 Tax=Microtetraspora sp. NBRC 16547 TaxID=3030993 RepID=UPI00331AF303